ILNTSSPWLFISFILAGILRYLVSGEVLQKSLANRSLMAIFKSTVSGMLLPICSCGVIPLGLGLYFSGAYLGPVLAFMTATPIINPAAIILSYGLLGGKITFIYLISGFVIPLIAGIMGNRFGGKEVFLQGIEERVELEEESMSFMQKIKLGICWAFGELALIVSKYVVLGTLFAGFLFVIFPKEIFMKYLGNPGILSLGSITLIAVLSYVCAVGHIPFIAALVASGASPGVALTFLIGGTGTNLPELISIYKVIGKRSVFLYGSIMLTSAFVVGYITNIILGDSFQPVLSYDNIENSIKGANFLLFSFPKEIQNIFSIGIIFYGIYGWVKR
ncbi:MAG: efflux transporter SaoE, partial [Cetobacterium sp.]